MKRLNRLKLLICLFVGSACMAFIRCSMPTQISGGGSDTEITGKIIDSNGFPVSHTLVHLVPNTFNPVEDTVAFDLLPADTTDSTGKYSFHSIDTGSTYNVQAIHLTQRTSLLITGIKASGDTTKVPTGILTQPGSISFLLRDTVDTINGYIYIKGTSVSRGLLDGAYVGGSYYSVVIDSVPSGDMPPIIYVPKKLATTQVILANTAVVLPLDTIRVSVTTKPIWRFSLVVAVDKLVCDYYGGLNSVIPYIHSQMNAASKAFNDTTVFNGIIDFGLDSFYVYTADLFDEVVKPLGGYDYRLLYDNGSIGTKRDSRVLDEMIKRYSNIYLLDAASVLFEQKYTGILIALLGELRGCLHLTECNVDSTKNSINKKGYYGIDSYMNISYIPAYRGTAWDAYNIYIANYNTDKVGNERDIIYNAFPAQTGIFVRSNTGMPVVGADIKVYGSILDSDSLNSKPFFQGVTDTAGIYLFAGNPFKPDTGNTIKYGNLLLSAVFGSDTAYTWFPLFEAGNAYFSNPNTKFLKELPF